MKHHIFTESSEYTVAVLIKSSSFNKKEIQQTYIQYLQSSSIAFDLLTEGKKTTAATAKEYLHKLLPALDSIGVKYLYVTDSVYFKTLTKVPKAEPHYGYVLPCAIKGYEHMFCVLGVNYQQLIFNPVLSERIALGLSAINQHASNTYTVLGDGIIHLATYPESYLEIVQALNSLHQYPSLTCDIEAFSLHFRDAGIGSIAFAWDKHNGIAFGVDDLQTKKQKTSIRHALRRFFETYNGTLIFHNASYDAKVLVYQLWMRHPQDWDGLLKGLHIMCRALQDTKVIAYVATNSTAGNELSLKALAHEYSGNYTVEVKDITKVPRPDLLKYNLIDALSTWFVFDKYWPIAVADQQETVYNEVLLPSIKTLIQTEIVGMPMLPSRVARARRVLEKATKTALHTIQTHPDVLVCQKHVQRAAMVKANAKLKTKQHPIEKFSKLVFNPNSGPQMQMLLYEVMQLPVLATTDSGLPSTDGDTLKALINHAQTSQKPLLQAFIDYTDAEKILSTFIGTFEDGWAKADNRTYLHGNFNLGGTVSGRLSSNSPNLQTIPSNSTYGKRVKRCFVAPEGWVFAYADFASLEDYISALTTKDKNKLKVYEDGFDGHCLRAAYYWSHLMPDIDATDPKSVNSIKKKYPQHRQDSKAPTFLLTYGGTHHGLMKNCGFSKDEALTIETKYHELYKKSDDWVQAKLKQASKDGYVSVAFGLRVRTPMLKQIMWNTDTVPYEAAAEGRTAGNALGQSYGVLTNRSTNAFMQKVWDSEYKTQILPIAEVHDATYFLIKKDSKVIKFANDNLIKEMEWQELPEIQHPTVKLGAALDLCQLGWHKPVTLNNNASIEEIEKVICKKTSLGVK